MPDAPGRVVVASGPIIALFDAGDAHHDHALEFVRRTRARLISSLAVVTEVMYVLLGIIHVASVDRDFTIYRCKGRSKFVNVFFP